MNLDSQDLQGSLEAKVLAWLLKVPVGAGSPSNDSNFDSKHSADCETIGHSADNETISYTITNSNKHAYDFETNKRQPKRIKVDTSAMLVGAIVVSPSSQVRVN